MLSMEKVESDVDQSEEDPLMDLLQKFDLVCLMPYLKGKFILRLCFCLK